MAREIAPDLRRWPALIDHPVQPRLTPVCDINPAALEWFRGIDTLSSSFDALRWFELPAVSMGIRLD
ncbi:hypothetical protein [Aestuariimicrobium ganziense]|uniref:hypothetical protein n=1 Tax=Aestuariimicrobium ganziense TaxID=2773677 RepID=UPI001941DB59|nr:hypothetical protein [Aestuariimicrobium ganziense]